MEITFQGIIDGIREDLEKQDPLAGQEEKTYITADGFELTKAEAEELNRQAMFAIDDKDFKKLLVIPLIFPKKLMRELAEREVRKNGRK